MGDWDFLYGLEGEELIEAMATGATKEEWAIIEREERKKEWEALKKLRDDGKIAKDEFKKRKEEIFG